MEQTDAAIYDSLKPELEKVEGERLHHLQRFEWRKKIAWPIGAAITAVCGPIDYWLLFLMDRGSDDKTFAGLTFIAVGILYRWVTSPKRDYIKCYKEKVMPHLARMACGLEYSAKDGIPMDRIKPSKIIPSYDKVESEDCFSGTHKGVDLTFNELHLSEMRGSGKHRRRVTTFKGLCILLSMKKRKFLGHTIVMKDAGGVGTWFTEKTNKLSRANLVDPVFEKEFNVYTNDQVEARYLIDPIVMQKLVDLCGHYQGDSLSAAYFESQMLVMIASKNNLFEPPDIYEPAIDIGALQMLRSEMQHILTIIDYLDIAVPERQSAA